MTRPRSGSSSQTLPVRDIAIALRFWTDNLDHAIETHLDIAQGQQAIYRKSVVMRIVPGASLTVGISLLERIVTDLVHQKQSGRKRAAQPIRLGNIGSWRKTLGLHPNWYGWQLLDNFIRLRHCFAHEYGRATKRQAKRLRRFLRNLEIRHITDDENRTIPPYYCIRADREIELTADGLHCFRRLIASFLRLLQRHSYVIA